ncbi:hypothetical protein JCM3770_003469 [Rhodotorula araucariae]
MTTELSISGVLPSALYPSAIERLSSLSERGEAFTASEEVFARTAAPTAAADGPVGADSAGGGGVLRVKALRKRSTGDAAQWSLQVNGRPEPPRTAPRAQQFGVTEFAIADGSDPRELASALGYGRSLFTLRRRGVRFQRGAVMVELFQLYETDTSPAPLDPTSHAVSVSTRFTAAPSASGGGGARGGGAIASQEVREASIAALEAVARALKGLVDVRRVD